MDIFLILFFYMRFSISLRIYQKLKKFILMKRFRHFQ